MTRLRNLVLGGAAAALLMTGAVSQSFALESGSFSNNLGGASEGLPLGAAPPPGVYSGFEQLFGAPGGQGGVNVGNQGHNAVFLSGVGIGIVPIVWGTGYKFFGGSLTLDVVQAFYNVAVSPNGGAAANVPGPFPALVDLPTVANTTFGGSLSWNLGSGFFFAAGFAFEAPDGTRSCNGGFCTANPDYWSFEPTAAISYLANNWVLSANFAYFINTASQGRCCNLGSNTPAGPGQGYTSGDELYVDFTALYKFGKWEIGPVGFIVDQTTNDSPGNGFTCASIAASGFGCGIEQKYGVGGLVGYDFGPVDLQVWVTDDVHCQDTAGCGVSVWTRLGFRVWAPEAPKPLVAKN
jgi:hypothetical protein